MDEQIPGSSRPKRQCTDFYKKKPLSDRELEELAEAFIYSESEVEISDLESESEISDSESNIDISDTEGSRGQGTTPGTSIVTSETLTWTDFPYKKDIQFVGNSGLLLPPGNNPYDFFSLLVTEDFLLHIIEQTNLYAEELFLGENTKLSIHILSILLLNSHILFNTYSSKKNEFL